MFYSSPPNDKRYSFSVPVGDVKFPSQTKDILDLGTKPTKNMKLKQFCDHIFKVKGFIFKHNKHGWILLFSHSPYSVENDLTPKTTIIVVYKDRSGVPRDGFFIEAGSRDSETSSVSLGTQSLYINRQLPSLKQHINKFSLTGYIFSLYVPPLLQSQRTQKETRSQ